MMPAQIVAGGVAVLADAGAQFPDLGDQGFAVEGFKVIVHRYPS